jgi:hypothetical protein
MPMKRSLTNKQLSALFDACTRLTDMDSFKDLCSPMTNFLATRTPPNLSCLATINDVNRLTRKCRQQTPLRKGSILPR